ncbi:Acyltransferase protein [Pseudomonas amygdali pv. mori]|uniref:Acyltransferase protein n=1 Tax=Pseudomonas amygdali pv. mori TaxID=34065 RepID=A0A3M5JD91_PSEA0|nr:Acyltransferase protein [Pseudomonas amygdali pv. mori]
MNFAPPITEHFEDTKQLAIEMDRQILGGYRLFPVHYLAYAQWSDADPSLDVPPASAVFAADELERAKDEWEGRLAGVPTEHRPYLIQQYATPVRNQYRVKAGLAL